ncbi:TPA: bleomycin binding protein Ble-MBL [Escherichia coli]|nr:bleomycin binding protein Ble-MBL [Escherichia coli]ELO0909584.1 bleomycin binding protein Ble-MBL [Escherichia coli]HAO1040344.1 bleomycin binding protein Ble-MBL [Escherichia coli]HAO1040618.1 bleomycin binding protein Ble-MBL [Escherichia coli]HAO1144366.1 bleomycin binding protein Ble-MBL [Escherichia coli]
MADHVTPNLPSRDFDVTEAFYAKLGFATSWKDRGWMILQRGGLQLEFFPYPDLDPATSSFGCCLRLDDLDAMVALVNAAGTEEKSTGWPRFKAPQLEASGLRIGYLIDPDCTLVRLIQNPD